MPAADACHDPRPSPPLQGKAVATPAPAVPSIVPPASAPLLRAWTHCQPDPPAPAGDDPAWRDWLQAGLARERWPD